MRAQSGEKIVLVRELCLNLEIVSRVLRSVMTADDNTTTRLQFARGIERTIHASHGC